MADFFNMTFDNGTDYPRRLNVTGLPYRSDPELLIGTLVLIIIIFTTCGGNAMVIYAVFTYRPLKRVQNFFIVSLACSDLAVATLVMPFHVIKFVASRWCFGLVICQLWLTSDILLCTASILNLCAIALDRYWAIHDPIKYANRRSKRLVLFMILGVWIASLLVSAPPLLGWNNWSDEGLAETCVYTTRLGFVVYSACCSFYMPLLVMTTVYVKIFIAARQRLHRQNTTVKRGLSIVEKSMRKPIDKGCAAAENETTDGLTIEYTTTTDNNEQKSGASPHRLLLVPYYDGFKRSNSRKSTRSNRSVRSTSSRASRRSRLSRFRDSMKSTVQSDFNSEGGSDTLNTFFREKEKISLSREKKAAKTLAVIMGGFVVCWLPFFTLYILSPFLPDGAIDPKIFEAANWLGYINSSINPVIYTIFNMDFRMAFRRIIFRKILRRKK